MNFAVKPAVSSSMFIVIRDCKNQFVTMILNLVVGYLTRDLGRVPIDTMDYQSRT